MRLWIWILRLFHRRRRSTRVLIYANGTDEPVKWKAPDVRELYRIRRNVQEFRAFGPFRVRIPMGIFRTATEKAFLERRTAKGAHFRTLAGVSLFRKNRDILGKA